MRAPFYSTSINRLKTDLIENGLNSSAASALHNWHFKKKKIELFSKDIAKETQTFIEDNYHFDLPAIDSIYESEDKTVKLVFKFKDGSKAEAILIPFHQKYSLCISSQVGCAMKCSFCFTGTQGFKRNLLAHEIVGQYLEAWRWLQSNRPGEERILNIVFMGQGEPLHNFDEVKKSCDIFLSAHGTSIGSQKITISTSGFIPGLKRWNKEMPQVNLALSLHSTINEKRDQLIPINAKYPLTEVLALIDKINLQKKQFVTYEYLLIDNFNDSPDEAHQIGKLLATKPAYINLIPFNPYPRAKYNRPSNQAIIDFKNILDTYKVPTIIRTTKGDDVLAACGQLNAQTDDNYRN